MSWMLALAVQQMQMPAVKFSTYTGVSVNGGTPQIIPILIGFSTYKPYILGYHYFWKHPYQALKEHNRWTFSPRCNLSENSERHRKKITRCCAFTKDTHGWFSFGDSQNGPVHHNLQQKPAKIRPKGFSPFQFASCQFRLNFWNSSLTSSVNFEELRGKLLQKIHPHTLFVP